jgi:hypothetical protein
MPMRSSAASPDDLLFLGMWLRIWSSMSSPMRLLMDPLAAASLCRTSAHCSSSFRARKMASSCPRKHCKEGFEALWRVVA